jgi:hypothetical protein
VQHRRPAAGRDRDLRLPRGRRVEGPLRLVDRRVAEGHGADGFASLIEALKRPESGRGPFAGEIVAGTNPGRSRMRSDASAGEIGFRARSPAAAGGRTMVPGDWYPVHDRGMV